MRKLFFIVSSSVVLAFILFLFVHSLVRARTEKGALQVTSVPESKVYLNDKYLGLTPLCKCEAADMLSNGRYTIRLVPLDNGLLEFQEKIVISEGVLTVVDRKFGKNSLSEGSVISLTPLADKKVTQLLVASFPRGATLLLDNNEIGKSPLLYKNPTESDHVLTVRKDGYKEKTIRIRTPAGYKLTVSVYLSTADTQAQTPASAVSSAPTTPKIVIGETPTGFLRVRQNNSVNAAEVGRVAPGETYDVLEEQNSWYKIKLTTGAQGWISSDYATKQ